MSASQTYTGLLMYNSALPKMALYYRTHVNNDTAYDMQCKEI